VLLQASSTLKMPDFFKQQHDDGGQQNNMRVETSSAIT
jgi:hypothetical protein